MAEREHLIDTLFTAYRQVEYAGYRPIHWRMSWDFVFDLQLPGLPYLPIQAGPNICETVFGLPVEIDVETIGDGPMLISEIHPMRVWRVPPGP